MPRKPNFTPRKKRKIHGATFWDQEYTTPAHLKLSTRESADLAKFTRWLTRRGRTDLLNAQGSVLDIGCGNGRNLIYLNEHFALPGIGLDISQAAIAQARAASQARPLSYHVQSAATPLPAADHSQTLVLDMMTSHFLLAHEREQLYKEIERVLIPGGFLFLKTFLRDKDQHTERLLREHPGPEAGTYIHPVMGVPEYAAYESELRDFLAPRFIIHRVYRSHKHQFRGRARKRRTISIYAERP